jgi:hypothetical protein
MADEQVPREEAAPPPSEYVHLPGPSLLPVIVAAGITLALVGVVVNTMLSAIGVVVTIGAIVKWVRETREDIAHLPLEH